LTIKYLLSKLIVYIICVNSCAVVYAQDNLSVLDSLIDDIVKEEFKNPVFNSGDTLSVLIPDSVSNLMYYTSVKIANELQQSGFRVFRNNVANGHVIELANVYLAIYYGEPYADSFLGADLCKRNVTLKLVGQIRQEPSGQILKSISKEKLFSDEIIYNDIEELETSSHSFTQGERRKYSTWDTIIEPALIVTSVVIVVLLFFTQRA
jgi:hypothetical protein